MLVLQKEEYLRRKAIEKNKRSQRLIGLYKDKVALREKKEEIKLKCRRTLSQIQQLREDKNRLYAHSNSCEGELVSQIALYNAKLYHDPLIRNKKVNDTYRDNIYMLKKFQESVKFELLQAKKELEAEAIDAFDELEKKQKEQIDKNIEQHLMVFDNMEIAKGDLELIKDDFAPLNKKCEKLHREQERLLREKFAKQTENKVLNKIYEEQTVLYEKLMRKHKLKFGCDIESSLSTSRDMDLVGENVYITSEGTKRDTERGVRKEKEEEEPSNEYFSKIISILNKRNEDIKKTNHDVLYSNSLIMRDKTNLKNLLEKCIEDLNFEYNQVRKMVDKSKTKKKKEKFENLKKRTERKLYIMSFIHDNVFKENKIMRRAQSSYSVLSKLKKRQKSV